MMRPVAAAAVVLALLAFMGPIGLAAEPVAPVMVQLRFIDDGAPVAATMRASHWHDGAWQYAGGPLDGTGSVTMDLRPGQWILQLQPMTSDGHLLGSGFLEVTADITATVDLDAAGPTVPLEVSIVDASTGAPVDVGEVAAQMLFGEYQCIGTRPPPNGVEPSMSGQPAPSPGPSEPCDLQWAEPGHLVGKVPPGVLTLRVFPKEIDCLVIPDEGHYPCYQHVPKDVSVAVVEGQSLAVTIPLLPVKEADAYVEGYLVSDVTGQAIPDKHVSFRGTGDYEDIVFSAAVDKDGSYRVGIPAGGYQAWGWVCGHDELTMPFEVATGETLRLDLRLAEAGSAPTPTPTPTPTSTVSQTVTPTTTSTASSSQTGTQDPIASSTPTGPSSEADLSYPGCDTDASDPGGGEADPGTDDGSSEPEPIQFAGTLAIIDFNGGLGRMEGATARDDGGLTSASRGSPALGPALVALALVVLAASARRRLD